MYEDELIQKLRVSFPLTASQVNESNKKGYRLTLSSPWRDNGLDVRYYHVQLCGIDPLTGKDVVADNISTKFDFSKKTHRTEVLNYHGTFLLRCKAHMGDGRDIIFKEQEIVLNYPQNAPYVEYSFSGKGEFKLVEVESNCWANCAGKLWLCFDGHHQLLTLRPRNDKTIRFYVPTSGTIEVKVQDEKIQVRNGR